MIVLAVISSLVTETACYNSNNAMYTQAYKFLSHEGEGGECFKRCFPSKLGKSWFRIPVWTEGGKELENVPPVRFKIKSNCEGRKKYHALGTLGHTSSLPLAVAHIANCDAFARAAAAQHFNTIDWVKHPRS